MPLNIQIADKVPASVDALAIPLTVQDLKKSKSPNASVNLKQLKALGFTGKLGECQVLSSTSNKKPELIIAVGVGEKENVKPEVLRRVGEELAKASKSFKSVASCCMLDLVSAKDKPKALQAHTEGLLLGSYSYLEYKSKSENPKLQKFLVIAPKNPANNKALKTGKDIAEAVMVARDLVNEPGGSMTPQKFATRAQVLGRKAGLKVKVMNQAAIEKAKMGGLLGVNRGSTQPPRFVEVHYKPTGKPKGFVALVGKGVTFDSGGLSIKPANYMMTMKCDMSGAAAVVSAMYAIAKLKLPIKVSAFIPLTDNMLGGDATRPGDVLTTHNKKTIEVLNTDAEGRLILADALSVASKAKPDAIIDLATLTGACVVALGEDVAGVLGNSQAWIKQVVKSSEETDEKVWQLPLVKEYKSQIESTIADMKNIGSNYAGTITAALLLQEFVDEKTPWAHLDIAGPAFKEAGAYVGGTGFGVRLLVDLVANFKKPKVDK